MRSQEPAGARTLSGGGGSEHCREPAQNREVSPGTWPVDVTSDLDKNVKRSKGQMRGAEAETTREGKRKEKFHTKSS